MRGDVTALDRRIVKIVKVVNDGDLPIAFAHQAIDEMGTDEAGTAGD
jgi:predicted SnoaL-like aldol condensation-catalyzing enzyme